MKVLITGINSGFGKALAYSLKSHNHEVIGISRTKSTDFKNFEVDLSDLEALKNFVKSEKIKLDLIIFIEFTIIR